MDGAIMLLDYSEYDREKVKIIFENIGEFEFIEIKTSDQYNSLSQYPENLSLIIMDIAFPVEKEGFGVLSSLRKTPATSNTPVIITTKSNSEEYRRNALNFNVSDFVSKPYQTKRLENSIRSIMHIEQNFRYSVSSANVITMSIEDYIIKEFKIASRAGQNLSIILITPLEAKDSSDKKTPVTAGLKERIYEIAAEKAKLSSRSTDTFILNDNKDILAILPFTDATGAQMVLKKINKSIDEGLKGLNMSYNDCFYAVPVTFPDDGKNFQALMEKAIKKVESKIMLEKITSIGTNAIDHARKTYKKFKI